MPRLQRAWVQIPPRDNSSLYLDKKSCPRTKNALANVLLWYKQLTPPQFNIYYSHCFFTLHINPRSFVSAIISRSYIQPTAIVSDNILMALWLVQFTKSPDLTKYSLEAFFPTKTSDVYLDYNYGTYFSGYKMCLPVQRWHRICHTCTHSDNGMRALQ